MATSPSAFRALIVALVASTALSQAPLNTWDAVIASASSQLNAGSTAGLDLTSGIFQVSQTLVLSTPSSATALAAVIITGQGPSTVLDCGGVGRAVAAYNLSSLTISKLTISNCSVQQNQASAGQTPNGGGALRLEGPQVVVINQVTFTGNAADAGGAVWYDRYGPGVNGTQGADIIIADCLFAQNSATTSGGAVDVVNSDSLTINGCQFLDNKAGTWGGSLAIFKAAGAVNIEGSQIIGGQAEGGGGVAVTNLLGSVTILDSSVQNCTARIMGGNVLIQAEDPYDSTSDERINRTAPSFTFHGGLIAGGAALDGAGLFVNDSKVAVSLADIWLEDNVASDPQGCSAVRGLNVTGPTTVSNVTLSNNPGQESFNTDYQCNIVPSFINEPTPSPPSPIADTNSTTGASSDNTTTSAPPNTTTSAPPNTTTNSTSISTDPAPPSSTPPNLAPPPSAIVLQGNVSSKQASTAVVVAAATAGSVALIASLVLVFALWRRAQGGAGAAAAEAKDAETSNGQDTQAVDDNEVKDDTLLSPTRRRSHTLPV